MASEKRNAGVAYATFSTFMSFMTKLRENGVPARIDRSIFGNASGSTVYSIIAALRALELTDDDSVPTASLHRFANAPDDERPELMNGIVRHAYPTLFSSEIDLQTTTAGQFDEHLKQQYDVKGSTVDKAATFFIAAAQFAEIPLSNHLKKRRTRSAPSATKRSSRSKQTAAKDAKEQAAQTEPRVEGRQQNPFVQGLLNELPEGDAYEDWDIQRQAAWLRTAAQIFGLLSKSGGTITVTVDQDK
jgi:hypothetical protein